MDKIITIFTPTYNRAYTLTKLYNSLKLQKNKKFLWLIVDDGSTDNTVELVNKWINDGFINIKYIKQENQGKHIAYNTAIENCSTELFFCVDSDDYLLDNAINDILEDYQLIKNEKGVCGIVSVRIKPNGSSVSGTYMPNTVNFTGICELSEKYKYKGDTSLVFKTDICRKYRFPKINSEKFIGEEYIYCQIDEKYKMYISHKKYYVCEYLEDGYTANIFKLIYDNPRGYMLLKQKRLELSINRGFFIRYKQASLYTVGCWLSHENFIKNSPNKFLSIISIPLAIIVYLIRFNIFMKGGK